MTKADRLPGHYVSAQSRQIVQTYAKLWGISEAQVIEKFVCDGITDMITNRMLHKTAETLALIRGKR